MRFGVARMKDSDVEVRFLHAVHYLYYYVLSFMRVFRPSFSLQLVVLDILELAETPSISVLTCHSTHLRLCAKTL